MGSIPISSTNLQRSRFLVSTPRQRRKGISATREEVELELEDVRPHDFKAFVRLCRCECRHFLASYWWTSWALEPSNNSLYAYLGDDPLRAAAKRAGEHIAAATRKAGS